VSRASATAKLNLALVVGPLRADGKHDVATVLQRLTLADRVDVSAGDGLTVEGFAEDTLVRAALTSLAIEAGVRPRWRARITKRIPVAAGLGGGSSDAATALRLANATLDQPLPEGRLQELARALGADVPFFLANGPQLGEEEGGALTPLDFPQDYFVLLVVPRGAVKTATGAVYDDFDRRGGDRGYDVRRAALLETVSAVARPRDLAALPPNDLVSSPLAGELRDLGAFRADVSGAGPTVYGLFQHRRAAVAARNRLRSRGRTWLTAPAWYG
jgi:4-diphosphocytidyl-2-C-methyl-D-erythritol kinase